MTKIQLRDAHPHASFQNICRMSFTLLFVGMLSMASSCSDDDDEDGGNVPMLTCTIKSYNTIESYNEFGAAMLDFTAEDMAKAGFTLGDVITITIGKKKIDMPYYDGFYGRNGEYLCVAYPTYPTICFTANNVGLPEELTGLEGTRITIKLKEKGGKIDVQEALSMTYSNERTKYPSDEAFANAREVTVGNIAPGLLYRTSSPFSDEICRAYYVSDYIEGQGVRTVLNLADTKEKMQSYDMPPYSRTLWENDDVILCPLKADPTADAFNDSLIVALQKLISHPTPYLVHCVEGKDRTGYVCALLEGLCGATYEEMVYDYLKTYENYYFLDLEKDRKVCDALVSLRLNMCLTYYADVEDEAELPNVDYGKAFASFLLNHGMTQEQIDRLVDTLTGKAGS